MISFLLSMSLSCEDAIWIIQGIRQTNLTQYEKSEFVLRVMSGTEDECDFV